MVFHHPIYLSGLSEVLLPDEKYLWGLVKLQLHRARGLHYINPNGPFNDKLSLYLGQALASCLNALARECIYLFPSVPQRWGHFHHWTSPPRALGLQCVFYSVLGTIYISLCILCSTIYISFELLNEDSGCTMGI